MSTNYYLVYREVVNARESISDPDVRETIDIRMTHIGKRSRRWTWHSITDNDYDDAVSIGAVDSVSQWREVLVNLPDNLMVLDEYDREVDPAELLDEWDNQIPYRDMDDLFDAWNVGVNSRSDLPGQFLDDEGYLLVRGKWF